jgi:hypothetical protein
MLGQATWGANKAQEVLVIGIDGIKACLFDKFTAQSSDRLLLGSYSTPVSRFHNMLHATKLHSQCYNAECHSVGATTVAFESKISYSHACLLC